MIKRLLLANDDSGGNPVDKSNAHDHLFFALPINISNSLSRPSFVSDSKLFLVDRHNRGYFRLFQCKRFSLTRFLRTFCYFVLEFKNNAFQ